MIITLAFPSAEGLYSICALQITIDLIIYYLQHVDMSIPVIIMVITVL